MNELSNKIISIYPSIDLHGEEVGLIKVLILDFIRDNIKLKNKYIVIIHGKGTYKLRDETHRILKECPDVLAYRLDNVNDGATIIKLKI